MDQRPVTPSRFNYRAFISAGMALSIMILPVSGLMNHQLQFAPMIPERHFWMSVHNMAGILFAVFSLVHMVLNRRALWAYISKKDRRLVSKELLAAAVIVAVPVFVFASHAFHVH